MKLTRAELTSRLQLECARQFGSIHRELDKLLADEQRRIADEVAAAFDEHANIAVVDEPIGDERGALH